MKNKLTKKYRGAIYLRLSKEDGDVVTGNKQESNSISNQKDLIMEFLKSKTDIEVVSVRADDGYSGVDFNRPNFQLLLEDIKKGKVDCVIVKDLSRFGRNYIEVGRYLEKIFPALGVRFIAINDNYDSMDPNGSQEIVAAFKNLVNDSYLRDLSVKIRSHLDVKRRKGEYVGSFVCYGYVKDENDKNKLVIDKFAAEVVKDIFRMKLNGMSPSAIAEALNKNHILSPMEYKKSLGMKYNTSFKMNKQALWRANAVTRILSNELYTGVLIQGRKSTPNHKIKKAEVKDEKEWVRIENAHEPIIERFYFDSVQMIMERETRKSPDKDNVYVLGGLLYCGDCGAPMIRQVSRGKRKFEGDIPKEYVYYICKTSRKTKECTSHRIKEDELLDTVFHEIQFHIKTVLDVKKILDQMDEAPTREIEIRKLDEHIQKKKEEAWKAEKLKSGIYEDLKDGILDKMEYQNLKMEFNRRMEEAEEAIAIYEEEKKKILDNKSSRYEWMNYFQKYHELEHLTREVAVLFLDRILIYEGKRIKIRYSFGDKLQSVLEYLKSNEVQEAM